MNLNHLDLNKLAVFSQIVESGNYRLASEVLNVTPSALSQTITILEHSLGVPLFHRIGKKLVLTSEGEKIQREFKNYHQNLKDSLQNIMSKKAEVSGLLQVGSYLEFAKFKLAKIVADFQKKNPDVQIKWIFDTPTRLHNLLEANKLDMCFSIYPERDSKLILSKPIYNEELVLVAPKGMMSEKPSFEEVISKPIVEYYFNHQPIRRWLTTHFKKCPKQLPIRTFGATSEMVLTLVEEGLGIGVIPQYLLLTKKSNNIITCRPSEKKVSDHIWMLRLKNKKQTAAHAAFTKAVETI